MVDQRGPPDCRIAPALLDDSTPSRTHHRLFNVAAVLIPVSRRAPSNLGQTAAYRVTLHQQFARHRDNAEKRDVNLPVTCMADVFESSKLSRPDGSVQTMVYLLFAEWVVQCASHDKCHCMMIAAQCNIYPRLAYVCISGRLVDFVVFSTFFP